MENVKSIIRNVKLFTDLTDEEIKPFLEVMTKRTFLDKNIIFLHETPITHVYIVASGKVKVFRNDLSGKEQMICVETARRYVSERRFFPERELSG